MKTTNWGRVKKMWASAKALCFIGLLFWITETCYFLICYGWHFAAINEYEKDCDKIVIYISLGGLTLTGIVAIEIIDYLLREQK